MRAVRPFGAFVGLAALLALVPGPAWAHTGSGTPDGTWTTGLALLVGPLILTVLAWTTAIGRPRRSRRGVRPPLIERLDPVGSQMIRIGQAPSRRAVVLVLSAWLVLCAGASATHSVHHLWDARGEADCVFAQLTHHAPGMITNPIPVVDPLPYEPARLDVRSARCPIRAPVPSSSRGPPFVAPASTSL